MYGETEHLFYFKKKQSIINSEKQQNFKALDDRYVTVSVLNKTISVCGIVSDEKKSRLLCFL
jgi:hypothetical protein